MPSPRRGRLCSLLTELKRRRRALTGARDAGGCPPHCTALHCTALHCAALHCTAPHRTALPCPALPCPALPCSALHCTAVHATPLRARTLTARAPNSIFFLGLHRAGGRCGRPWRDGTEAVAERPLADGRWGQCTAVGPGRPIRAGTPYKAVHYALRDATRGRVPPSYFLFFCPSALRLEA